MEDFFSRSEALLGEKVMESLRTVRVLLFGVGGVGSWCAESLIRTGLIHLTIVDGDTVRASNINRQLPATRESIGKAKVVAMRERLLAINPEAEIYALPVYYKAQSMIYNVPCRKDVFDFQFSTFDYVVDAIDSVPDKTDLLLTASRVRGVKIFSSMGAALRFDPTKVTTGEFMQIKGDALARAVRERMKRLGCKPSRKIQCVYSTENARPLPRFSRSEEASSPVKGSLMPVTAVFGCTLASLVINDLCRRETGNPVL